MSRLIIVVIVLAVAVLAGCQEDTPEDVGAKASAAMTGPDGADMGTVTLTQGPNGVLVSADARGLAPGFHGFHIHETGDCTPDFSAAGGHFNPEEIGHGFMEAEGWHEGDMPNIYAGMDGIARADYFSTAVTLAEGADTSIFDDDGSAIIIHEKPDTYGADPGAGSRVACGVIERD